MGSRSWSGADASVIAVVVKVILCAVLVQCQQAAILSPGVLVATAGVGNYPFFCVVIGSTKVSGAQWFINGTPLEDLNLTNVERALDIDIIQTEAILFSNVSVEMNRTQIECKIIFGDGSSSRKSPASLLYVQGLLGSVGSLSVSVADESTVNVSWTAPFSLNLSFPHEENILGYCVMATSRIPSSISFPSTCDFNTTSFLFPAPLGCNDVFTFTVSAVNPVGIGEEDSVSFFRQPGPSELVDVILGDAGSYILNMSSEFCEVDITLEDLDTGQRIVLQLTNLTINHASIIIARSLLMSNRRYVVTISTNNSVGYFSSFTMIITHDISGIINVIDNQIHVLTQYFEDSSASGALYALVHIREDGGVDFSKSALLSLDRKTSHNATLPFRIFPGQNRVFVYGIEQSGTLTDGMKYPAVSHSFRTSPGSEERPIRPMILYIEDCIITTPSNLLIHVECTYTDPDSQATGFQILAQTSIPEQVQEIYASRTTDRSTAATITVEEFGAYQVTVFVIREMTGILSSSADYTELVMVQEMDDVLNTMSQATLDLEVSKAAEVFPIKPVMFLMEGVVFVIALW